MTVPDTNRTTPADHVRALGFYLSLMDSAFLHFEGKSKTAKTQYWTVYGLRKGRVFDLTPHFRLGFGVELTLNRSLAVRGEHHEALKKVRNLIIECNPDVPIVMVERAGNAIKAYKQEKGENV